MIKIFLATVMLCISVCQAIYSQTTSIDRDAFFNDTSIMSATILANTSKLFSHEKKGFIMPAHFITKLSDGTNVDDQIQLEMRGHFRHDYCYIPPLKLIFKYKKSSVFYSLKSTKLVSQCKMASMYNQYILKEFLVYKMFNLLTDMSFRVRLLNINFQDSAGKKKPVTEHAFLMEDLKDLAKRNNCIEWAKGNLNTESTHRRQMTIISIFEYMIGNTDFAVSANHNIRLIVPDTDSLMRPFAVPYDFDYSGLVNAEYAVPDEKLEIENVRVRVYRGFKRTMPELNEVVDIFKQKKEKIYALVNNFDLLNSGSKREMTDYLDAFFDIIKDPRQVKSIFIDGARTL